MTLDAIEDSRQRGGVLELDGDEFQKQATEVYMEPSAVSVGDRVEVLSGQVLAPSETYDWTLNLGYIQDFTDADGLVMTLRDKAGLTVPFTWTPNGSEGPTFEGNVLVRPTTIGGAVATRLTGTVQLPITDYELGS